jgi:hypothetical protein
MLLSMFPDNTLDLRVPAPAMDSRLVDSITSTNRKEQNIKTCNVTTKWPGQDLNIISLRSILMLSTYLYFGLSNRHPPCELHVQSVSLCATYRTDGRHHFPIIGPQLEWDGHLEGLLVSARQQSTVPTQVLFLSL